MNIGKIIRKLRISMNLTQEALAAKLYVERSTIAKWESGQAKPRADTLIKLAAVLGCTVDELLKGEENGENTK